MAARPASHSRKGLKGLQLTLLTPPSAITVFSPDEIEKEKVERVARFQNNLTSSPTRYEISRRPSYWAFVSVLHGREAW